MPRVGEPPSGTCGSGWEEGPVGGDRNGLLPYVLVLSKGTQAPPTTRPLLPALGRGPASPAQHFGIGLLSSAVTWVGQPAGEQICLCLVPAASFCFKNIVGWSGRDEMHAGQLRRCGFRHWELRLSHPLPSLMDCQAHPVIC